MKSRSARILSPLLMLTIVFQCEVGNAAEEEVTLTFVCRAENLLIDHTKFGQRKDSAAPREKGKRVLMASGRRKE